MSRKEKDSWEKVDLKEKQITGCLKEVSIFRDVPEKQLAELAGACFSFFIKRGGYIYRRDRDVPYMVIIYSGCALVYIGFEGTEEMLVKIRRRGDYIGEMGVLGNQPQPCNVIAQEDTIAVLIPKLAFCEFLKKNHNVVSALFQDLIGRINQSSRKLINTIYMEADGKLAYSIARLMVSAKKCEEGMYITVSQKNLAMASGLSRQSVARVLTQWKQENWIMTRRNKIIILNQDAILNTIVLNEMK